MIEPGRIEFDPGPHVYRLDGRVVPGVTSVIDPLTDFSSVPPPVLAAARDFGTAVHIAIAYEIEGTLDETTLDPRLLPYLQAWRKFLVDTGFVIEANELRIASAKFQYAGTLDLLGALNRKRSLIDFKSGAVPKTIGLQTGAYEQALLETRDLKVVTRYALQLASDGSYKLVPCLDRDDFNVFLSALNVKRWRDRVAA